MRATARDRLTLAMWILVVAAWCAIAFHAGTAFQLRHDTHTVRSGTVVRHDYRPAQDTVYVTNVCVNYSGLGCTSWTPVVQHNHITEQFSIQVEDKHGHKSKVDVDRFTWQNLANGQHYEASK